jgi:hypothetical protein
MRLPRDRLVLAVQLEKSERRRRILKRKRAITDCQGENLIECSRKISHSRGKRNERISKVIMTNLLIVMRRYGSDIDHANEFF